MMQREGRTGFETLVVAAEQMEDGGCMGDGSASPVAPAERSKNLRYFYSKRSPLGEQALSAADAISGHAPPCNGLFEIGAFYEIDHEKLPPKSPIQLKAIRVVKVSETTTLDATVSFPSGLSLRNYFSGGTRSSGPELDERFVMGMNQAMRILWRLVPPSQVDEEKHLESFWVLAHKATESPPGILWTSSSAEVGEEEGGDKTPLGACHLALKSAGVVGWGVRRKVRYVGRHREMPWWPEANVEEAEEPGMWVEEDNQKQQPQQVGKKRAREDSKKKKKKKKKKSERKDRKNPKHGKWEGEKRSKDEGQKESRGKGTQERWSAERYGAAELKLLEIMRGMKAELGSPVLRQMLRDEARKHIGDTGLLDHLLKHMAGKIVDDGCLRFRRRHNAEGAMEYWLEPADLAEIRRKAGVADPYWIPPPGWKLGDAIYPCSCGTECRAEITRIRQELAGMAQLKDEVVTLKREVELLSTVMQLEKEAKDAQYEACRGCTALQADYTDLLRRNRRLEEDMASMSSCLHELKELLNGKSKKEAEMTGCLQALKEEIHLMKEGSGKREEESAKLVGAVIEDKRGQGDENTAADEKGRRGTNSSTKHGSSSRSISMISSNTSNGTAMITVNRSRSSNNNNDNVVSGTASGWRGRAVRRSGFTICKPQGTFLWPNMAGSSDATISGGGRVSVQGLPVVPTTTLEDHLALFGSGGVPTPRSASSATSAPRLLILPRTAAPELVAVPTFPAQAQQQLRCGGETTASSDNISSSSLFCHMARASSSSMAGGGGGGEGKKREEVATGSWESAGGAWSNITTDLALATPSSTYL